MIPFGSLVDHAGETISNADKRGITFDVVHNIVDFHRVSVAGVAENTTEDIVHTSSAISPHTDPAATVSHDIITNDQINLSSPVAAQSPAAAPATLRRSSRTSTLPTWMLNFVTSPRRSMVVFCLSSSMQYNHFFGSVMMFYDNLFEVTRALFFR